MSKATPQEGLDEFLAEKYEVLKRHEETLYDLRVQTEALKSVLTDYDRQILDQSVQRALAASREEHALQLRLFDKIIARLRDT